MLFRSGFEPDRPARRRQQLEGRGLGDETAAGRQHEAGLALQDGFERAALVAAKHFLAEQFEQLAQLDAALPLDLAVELDEGHREALRQRATQRRLARAPQTHQRDPLRPHLTRKTREAREHEVARGREIRRRQAVEELREQHGVGGTLRLLVDELGQGYADRPRHPAQQHDRNIAPAGFELRQIAFRHVRVARKQLAREAAAVAHRAHAFADTAEKFRELVRGRLRRPGRTHGLGSRLRHGPLHELHYNASQKRAAVNRLCRGGSTPPREIVGRRLSIRPRLR